MTDAQSLPAKGLIPIQGPMTLTVIMRIANTDDIVKTCNSKDPLVISSLLRAKEKNMGMDQIDIDVAIA
ncbi:MAG: hypothetical protein LIP09_08270 [Bacteroidales bacterium]|nr:hypothetical protein [Bacteroidales bacterium]